MSNPERVAPERMTAPPRLPRRRSRRSIRLNRIIAGISWGLGGAALLFEIWVIARGKADEVNLVNSAFAVIGTAIGGLLALKGDGDVILFTGADEGQRDAIARAGMPAFGLAFWGLFVLWMAYQFQPAWRAAAYLHVGILLLLTGVAYLLGYLWQRRGG